MKIKELRKLIREEISNLNTSIQVGNSVTIPRDLTTDPYNKRGQTGKVVHINRDLTLLTVEFEDGSLGVYDVNIFGDQTTTYDDVIERDRQRRSKWKPFKETNK